MCSILYKTLLCLTQWQVPDRNNSCYIQCFCFLAVSVWGPARWLTQLVSTPTLSFQSVLVLNHQFMTKVWSYRFHATTENSFGRNLWKSLVQPPAQSWDNIKVGLSCSEPSPVAFGKSAFWGTELVSFLNTKNPLAWLSSLCKAPLFWKSPLSLQN